MSALENLPHALTYVASVANGRRPVFFLDYDGTLTPIVQDPDNAKISEETRATLRTLGTRYVTAIISGRGLEKIRKLVGLDHLIYAGSHGFDIDGPSDVISAHTVGLECRPALQASAEDIRQNILPRYGGSTVEDNRFSISIHYRNCNLHKNQLAELEADVDAIANKFSLKKTFGKKVLELRPHLNWNKGKAVEYLLEVLQLKISEVLPVYIGDDMTDEDAFRALPAYGGIAVLVSDCKTVEERQSAANCRLRDPDEVREFLAEFALGTNTSTK